MENKERLTAEELNNIVGYSFGKQTIKQQVKLLNQGTVSVINGVAYDAVDIALLKLWKLENMIQRGELVDVTVFDSFMSLSDEPKSEEPEGTFINVIED